MVETRDSTVSGRFRFHPGPDVATPIDIEMNRDAMAPRMTFAHEFGHYVQIGVIQRDAGADDLFRGWREAVRRSAAHETLAFGPDHVEAPCPHFGTCGGCRWQDLAYERHGPTL